MNALEAARDRHLAAYEDFAASLGEESPLLSEIRQQGAHSFRRQGLPSRKLENWRYTNLARLAKLQFGTQPSAPRSEAASTAATTLEGAGLRRFSLRDGRFEGPQQVTSERENGLELRSLAELRAEEPEELAKWLARTPLDEHPFAALNTAFLDDGVRVRATRGDLGETGAHLVVSSTSSPEATVSHPRVLVVAEPESRLHLLIDYVSDDAGTGFTNAVTELRIGAGADVQLVILQREGGEHFHIGGLFVHQERDSRFSCHTLSLGGALVRNDLEVKLAGRGAVAQLRGLFVAGEGALADNHTRVDHALPHCESQELYKGVIGEGGRGVFHGHVKVHCDAQRTLAEQRNANLLLGRDSEIDTRPQLEINADDVRCSHGSTIGQLDAEALFYLRSRGLAARTARKMLTRALAEEILSDLRLPRLAASLAPVIDAHLSRLRGQEAA